MELAEPMLELKTNIYFNIDRIKNESQKLKNAKSNKIILARNIYPEIETLEIRTLSQPTIVCTSPKCIEYVKNKKGTKINYKIQGCALRDADLKQNGLIYNFDVY